MEKIKVVACILEYTIELVIGIRGITVEEIKIQGKRIRSDWLYKGTE